MAQSPEQHREVLVIHADAAQRVALERACRAVGLAVVAAGSIAEVDPLPVGQIVITDAAHLTPRWRQLGAVEVILLVGEKDDTVRLDTVECGATRWLQPPPPPEIVAAMVLALRGNVPGGKTSH